MTAANGWNSVELRDNRYNQIVHMVSAANGAEEFYSTEVSAIDRAFYIFCCTILFELTYSLEINHQGHHSS